MADPVARVDNAIASRSLLKCGEAVLVAVSGGLDSMVLLHVLHGLAPRHQWRLVVAHLHHGLRGQEADADLHLVETTARELGLEFHGARTDVRRQAADEGVSVEMAARKARHEFLVRTAREVGARCIALAHHADDQVEQFFLRLIRGAGNTGLAGMAFGSPSPVDLGLRLVRPLLGESRATLLAWAKARRIRFRDDRSNRDTRILRNRIRHRLIPLLERAFQPGIRSTVLQAMDLLGAETEVVVGLAQRWLQASRKSSFERLPVAVQRQCLRLQCLRQGVVPDFGLIERLRSAPDIPFEIGPRRIVRRDTAGIVSTGTTVSAYFRGGSARFPLGAEGGEMDFGGLHIQARLGRPPKGRGGRIASVAGLERFDAVPVGREVILRHWRPGDRFQPIGMPSPVKLQDLFTNAKVPTGRRQSLVLATTAAGEIFWVEGLRISERFKIVPNTRRGLLWRWERASALEVASAESAC